MCLSSAKHLNCRVLSWGAAITMALTSETQGLGPLTVELTLGMFSLGRSKVFGRHAPACARGGVRAGSPLSSCC